MLFAVNSLPSTIFVELWHIHQFWQLQKLIANLLHNFESYGILCIVNEPLVNNKNKEKPK
ncbi:MAG: hypothetical protein AUF64_00295 [Chloroflexi bacterium 13_1_20CM_54_36]|nr:MAG: hypothetical protein AUF64_00295 [Chloroflexi bacterium 13_1_20CM_54_36]OLE51863.1 MAG: hypothetical protein AUG51_20805 [Acidobacteria bacterium 13_1_20CM_3_53_8]